MKNIVTKSKILVLSSMLIATSLFAKDKVETLTVHHFLSSKSPAHVKFLVPWAKKVEKASNGRLKIEIFPQMTMGGKPPELYKQARDGMADIVWAVAGYTPGVFIRTEVFELPTVHTGDAVATAIAINENFDLIKDDFKKIKPLLVYVHAGQVIHTTNKKVEKMSDLKGLKLRTPSRTGGWLIEEFGAEPVGMPLPATPQALSKNAVDGLMTPFEVFPPFKFQQLTKYSIVGKGDSRFGTSVFLMLMNQNRFKSLPKDLQKILEDSVDLEMAKETGQLWMDIEKPGQKMQRESKDSEIITLSDEAMKDFNEAGEKVVQRWIKEVSKKGIDGQKLVDSARKSIIKHSK